MKLLPNSGLAASKPKLKRMVLLGKEKLQEASNLREGGLMPQNQVRRLQFLKGKSFKKGVKVFVIFHCLQNFFDQLAVR